MLVIDVQNDFMPFGALPVANGDEVVAVANHLMGRFEIVVGTQDWHPRDHGSFAVNHPGASPGETVELGGVSQVLWPVHCVQGTPGASFHSALDVAGITHVIRKGSHANIDSYSGFFDNGRRKSTGMADLLTALGVAEVVVCGLATDYCVKATALDALDLGFGAAVVTDGCRAVNLSPGDGSNALREMADAGARVIESGDA